MTKKDKQSTPTKVDPNNPIPAQPIATPEGMVVGPETKPEPVPTIMIEAVDSLKEVKAAVSDAAKFKIQALLGLQLAAVKDKLEAMIKSGEIGVLKIVKTGQGFDGEYCSNRVQICTQGPDERISDIQVG